MRFHRFRFFGVFFSEVYAAIGSRLFPYSMKMNYQTT